MINEEYLKTWEQDHIELLTSKEMGEWLYRRDKNQDRKERPQGKLIDREALKSTINEICGKCSNIITKYENGVPDGNCAIQHILNMIDNAPTVDLGKDGIDLERYSDRLYQNAYKKGYEQGKEDRPQVTVFCENADEKTTADLKNELTQDLINKITVNAGLAQPIKEEIPQSDIRWTDKIYITSSGDIIDFEGRVVGHINLEDMKGGAE